MFWLTVDSKIFKNMVVLSLIPNYKTITNKNMQTYLKQIETFLLSNNNIFNSTSLDYPSNWQQQLILSYFYFKQTLQKQHTQIIRDLNTQSQKQLIQISQGCLYMLLIDAGNLERLAQYLMILRIDVWNIMAQQFIILLAEYGDIVKLGFLANVRVVIDRLMFYNLCQPFLLCLVGNYINSYDRSPDMLAVIRSILQLFIDKLQQGYQFSNQIKLTLFLYIFPKIVRINPYIEQKLCTKLIVLLSAKYPLQILFSSKQFMYIIESDPKCLQLPHLYQLYRKIKNTDDKTQHYRQQQQIIFSYLPRRVQLVFQFIFKENVKGGELNYQLNWLEKSWYNKKYYYHDILVDMARWTTSSSQFIQQRVTILDWIIKRISSNPLTFQKVKRAIFSNWFVNQAYYQFDRTLTSLILVRHLLTTDGRMGVDLLRFILKYQSGYSTRIQQILESAIKLNHFSMQFILDNRVPEIIQQDFVEILKPKKKQATSAALQFNPDSPVKSDDEENINYNVSSSEEPPIIIVPTLPTSMVNEVGEMFLNEDYVEEFNKLEDLLNNPNYENFIGFFKEFTEIGQQNRTSNKGFLDILVKQTAKILYCAYNNQFQDLNQPVTAQQSIINYIILLLLKSWHQVTFKIILVKSLVKKLFQLFPTSEVSFWYYFFAQFQFGGLNNREFKNWLVPKQKSDFVVKAVETLIGRNDENFRKKVSKYATR